MSQTDRVRGQLIAALNAMRHLVKTPKAMVSSQEAQETPPVDASEVQPDIAAASQAVAAESGSATEISRRNSLLQEVYPEAADSVANDLQVTLDYLGPVNSSKLL